MKDFRYLRNVATLELRESACIGCGRCVEVCPHKVFSLAEKRSRIVDFDGCMECGACAKNCPTAAIKVDAGVGCASGLITEWLRERNIRGVGGGCCS
ncbi:mercury methylation ferredoxin HgcB [Geotalea uraniireducens]|uniref:4Fe-4S ferredoxin, iron-sulfur binding domain protein n=1 Tax=Geotalea uraniireducens (strain Rf4) TaxID=351605 RepID=A5GCK5_GEOUR|nr:mercury methylation ferredoxin HgcB [Geotalea uraniireducens]ABQ24696.1 4Fe-4S ferredoxin, iron-sulfur binding domain protein [Geotalea uraniireducens Rf4]